MPLSPLRLAPRAGALLLCWLCACASAPRAAAPERAPASAEPSELPEPAALSLIDRLLLEQRQLPVEGWEVRLPEQRELEVDLRIGSSRFGVEWVSAGDRARDGKVLPAPDPSGQLRVVRAQDAHELADGS